MPQAPQSTGLTSVERRGVIVDACPLGASSNEEDSSVQIKSYSKDSWIILLRLFRNKQQKQIRS